MKEVLKEFFELENKKYESIFQLDLNGTRILRGIKSEILKTKKKISNLKDPSKLLEMLAVDYENLDNKIQEIKEEVNSTRREQLSRVNAIKDCYNLLIDYEKKQEAAKKKEEEERALEEQRVDKIVERLEAGEDPEKDVRPRGTRPEKIKDIKLAKAKFDKSKNIT